MAKPKIVVSHISLDTAFASKLVADLNTAGAEAWMDANDLGAKQHISETLANCEWCLVVLTPEARVSLDMHDLADAAINLRINNKIKGLIFIRLGVRIDRRQLPLAWRTAKFINATLDYQTALDRTLEAVGLKPTSETTLVSLTAQTLSSSQEIMNLARKNGTNVGELGNSIQKPLHSVFISYRRDDSAAGYAGHLRADLVRRYGADKIFMDLSSIDPGVDFVDTLENAVGSCAVLLAVIGRHWLTVTDATTGKRRLDNLDDWVRVEIATALERNIRVIPLLFHRATMPSAADLPDNLKPLVRRQAHEITDQRWDYDVGNLVSVIDKIVGYKAQDGNAS